MSLLGLLFSSYRASPTIVVTTNASEASLSWREERAELVAQFVDQLANAKSVNASAGLSKEE